MFGLGNGYACTPSVIFMFFFKKKLSSWFGLAYTNSRHCWTGVKRPLNFTVQKYKIMLLKRKSQMESSAARTVLSGAKTGHRFSRLEDSHLVGWLGFTAVEVHTPFLLDSRSPVWSPAFRLHQHSADTEKLVCLRFGRTPLKAWKGRGLVSGPDFLG